MVKSPAVFFSFAFNLFVFLLQALLIVAPHGPAPILLKLPVSVVPVVFQPLRRIPGSPVAQPGLTRSDRSR